MNEPRHLSTDLHCHSTYSDGRATVPELVARAQRIGFDLAISDHYSIDQQMNSPERLDVYLTALAQFPVYRSAEIDIGEALPLPAALRARMDYVIGSMHNVTRPQAGRFPLPISSAAGREEYMEAYVEALVQGIATLGIAFIGHPTFLVGLMPSMQREMHDALWTPSRRRRVIEAAVTHQVAFEISTRYQVPTPIFLQDALEAGATFAVGSDSHWLDRMAEISLPRRYVEEYGITPDRFFLPERRLPVHV